MKFSFVTLFPQLIAPFFQESILKRAIQKNLISINTVSLLDFVDGKNIDSTQIGGGAGQVLRADTLSKAIYKLEDSHIIFLTPAGKKFTNKDAKRLATQKKHIAFVCGRYEGIDERAIEIYADEVFCIGDFILTGGELPALCMCDSISRQVEGVLGNNQSLDGESFEEDLLEAPIFARISNLDKNLKNLTPPSEYSKGNHNKITDLKKRMSICKTKYFRLDLYRNLHKKGAR